MLDAVKQWAFTLVITAIIGYLANSFVLSESGGMKKYVKFACSAVALVVMIMPIKEMFYEMPKLFDFNIKSNMESENYTGEDDENIDMINELTIAKTEELLKERISDIVYEKTGIKPDNVYIYIGQEDYPEIDVEKIVIDMPGNTDKNKTGEIELYLKQIFNCEIYTGEKINE